MARTLPWTAGSSAQPTKAPSKRSTTVVVKKEAGHENAHRPRTPEAGPSRTRKRAASRSPSTSPIQPPAQPARDIKIEPMRPGPTQDDRYIMVEDEFEAIARTFTAHLHAAEYARLKRKAKQAHPKPLPSLPSNASRSTKIQFERKQLLSRQGTTLSEFSRRTDVADGENGDEDGDGDEEEGVEEKVLDPWLGTSLAGLMDREGQTKRSLIGLERVNSSTRAARGFGRGESEISQKERRSILDDHDQAGNGKDRRQDRRVKLEDEDGVPSHRGKERVSTKKVKVEHEHEHEPVPSTYTHKASEDKSRAKKESTVIKRESSPRAKLVTGRSGPRRSRIDELDDFEERQLETTSPARRTRSPGAKISTGASSTVGRRADGKRVGSGKDRKARLDEVPVFLV